MAPKKHRNVCATKNNYTSEDIEHLTSWAQENCSYSVYGQEEGKLGTPHLQIYLEFNKQLTKSQIMKKLFNCHVEDRRGTPKEAAGYCKKGTEDLPEDDMKYDYFFDHPSKTWIGCEFGEISNQGCRTDLLSIRQQIENGETSVDQIVLEDPMTFHMYGRTLSKIEDILLRKKFRTEMTHCTWYCGATGVGKSHAAFKDYHPDTHYVWKLNDNGWQDGYIGQKIIIINDFRGEIKYNELLNLIDKWPYTLPRRGREPVPFLGQHVIITSSLRPETVYNRRELEDSLEQLLRRIKIVTIEKGQMII